MKKNKKNLFLICIWLSVFLMGCNPKIQSEDNNLVNIDGIYIVKNLDFNAIINEKSMLSGFDIPIISSEKIDLDDLKIDIPVDSKYDCKLSEMEVEEMPYYVFQSYKKTDWSKLKKLSEDENKSLEFTEYQDKYIEEYNKSKKKNNFYYYKLFINFDVNSLANEKVEKVLIQYNNKDYSCTLNGLEIRTKSNVPSNINDKKEFYTTTVGLCENYAVPNEQGLLEVNDIEYKAEGDVTIKNISICDNDSISIEEVYIISDDVNMNKKFNGNMKLSDGNTGEIRLKLKDDKFKSKLMYYSNMNLDIELEVNNIIKHETVFLQFNTKLDPYEVYAHVVDELDVLSYYTDFYSYYYND